MNFKPLSLTLLLLASTSTLLVHADDSTCDKNVTPTAPDSRFQDLGNGEVKDLKTNLIWQRCSIGQTWNGTTCTGQANGELTWQQALKKTKALGNGYRLPNFKELISIIDLSCKPAINSNIFPNTPAQGYHWTSTPHARDNNQVFILSFEQGDTYLHAVDTGYVTKEIVADEWTGAKKTYAIAVRNEK